jgi:hypothetical protein
MKDVRIHFPHAKVDKEYLFAERIDDAFLDSLVLSEIGKGGRRVRVLKKVFVGLHLVDFS